MKKDGNGMFDVTMGCFDGAEVCELVGAFALVEVTEEFASKDIGLYMYRDDGLAVLRGVPGCTRMCCRQTKDKYNASISQTLAQNCNRSKPKGGKLLGCYNGPGQQQKLTL